MADVLIDWREQITSGVYGFAHSSTSRLISGKRYKLIINARYIPNGMSTKGRIIIWTADWSTINTSIAITETENVTKELIITSPVTGSVNVSCYAYSYGETSGAQLVLNWYKLIADNGNDSFDIHDAYASNGPLINLANTPPYAMGPPADYGNTIIRSNGGASVDINKFGYRVWKIDTTSLAYGGGLYIRWPSPGANIPLTISFDLYYENIGAGMYAKIEGGTDILNEHEKKEGEWVKYRSVTRTTGSSQTTAVFYTNGVSIYYIKNIKITNGQNAFSAYTPSAHWTPNFTNIGAVDNFVGLQGACRNIPYFAGTSGLVYKDVREQKTMAAEYKDGEIWVDRTEGTWSVVSDPVFGEVVQYVRSSGSLNCQWNITNNKALDYSVLNGKTVSMYVVAKPLSNQSNLFTFRQWGATANTAPILDANKAKQVQLGNGWILYYDVYTSTDYKWVRTSLVGLGLLTGTTQFYCCGIVEGDITTMFDLASWIGFKYMVYKEGRDVTDADWTTNSVTITATPTAVAATGGTSTLSAVAKQTRGIKTQYRACYSDGTQGPWYPSDEGRSESRDLDISTTAGVFARSSGVATLSARTVTYPNNTSLSSRSSAFTATYGGKTSAPVTVTQAAGYYTYSDITISSFSYPKISPSATSASPSLSYSQTYGWNGAASGVGTVTTGAATTYTWGGAANGFTAINSSTGVLTATNMGTTEGNRNSSNISVKVSLNGKEKQSGNAVCQQGTNGKVVTAVNIRAGDTSQLPDLNFPAAGVSNRRYSNNTTYRYDSGATATREESGGVSISNWSLSGSGNFTIRPDAHAVYVSAKNRTNEMGSAVIATLTFTYGGVSQSVTLIQAQNVLKLGSYNGGLFDPSIGRADGGSAVMNVYTNATATWSSGTTVSTGTNIAQYLNFRLGSVSWARLSSATGPGNNRFYYDASTLNGSRSLTMGFNYYDSGGNLKQSGDYTWTQDRALTQCYVRIQGPMLSGSMYQYKAIASVPAPLNLTILVYKNTSSSSPEYFSISKNSTESSLSTFSTAYTMPVYSINGSLGAFQSGDYLITW